MVESLDSPHLKGSRATKAAAPAAAFFGRFFSPSRQRSGAEEFWTATVA